MQPTTRTFVALTLILLCACTSEKGGQESSTRDVSSHLWPLSTKSEDARKFTDAGEVASDAGLGDDALQNFKRAVAADSAFAYGYLRIAQTGYSLDEYRANLQRANAFKTTANPAEKLLIEAENKIFAGDIQAGLDSLRKLSETLPGNPRAPYVLSLAQGFTAGQTDSARATLKKAMDIAPKWGISHLTYGASYVVEPRDLALAETHNAVGRELWPDKAVTYDLLGDLRRAQNRVQDAAVSYTRQIELSPNESTSTRALSSVG